jgi:hypothetical protein
MEKKEPRRICIIPGVPVKDYPIAPPDDLGLTESYRVNCPGCKNQMWYTYTKLNKEKEWTANGVKPQIQCWDCLKNEVEDLAVNKGKKVKIQLQRE